MLFVKGAYKGHAHDSHYLLRVILAKPHYMCITSNGHAGLSLMSIKLRFSCNIRTSMCPLCARFCVSCVHIVFSVVWLCVIQSVVLCTVEPWLSNPHLSVSSIIRNDVWKFLKQVMPNC